MEEEVIKKEKTGSYLTGIIGAIIGGIIATIPWILVYVYGNMMLSILAAIIAGGEFLGYKICKGKIDKKLPIIIMVIAVIIVMVTTLAIIPALLIQKQGLPVSITNVQKLYGSSEFSTAITKDCIISVVFTILGASIITSNIKKQLENNDGKEVKIQFSNNENINKMIKESIEELKPIFEKYEATTPDKAMMKEEVLAEISEDRGAKIRFKYLKQMGIIKKYKGKYYYSKEAENNPEKRQKKSAKAFIISMIVIIVGIIILAILGGNNPSLLQSSEKIDYKDSNISFQIAGDWKKINTQYSQYVQYYKYINTFPDLNQQTNQTEEQEEDYSSYPAMLVVTYEQVDTTTIKSIEDVKTNIEESINKSEEKPDTLEMNISKTANNYDILKVKVIFNSEPQEIMYNYYILTGDKIARIVAESYSLEDDKEIESVANDVSNSFTWVVNE